MLHLMIKKVKAVMVKFVSQQSSMRIVQPLQNACISTSFTYIQSLENTVLVFAIIPFFLLLQFIS